MLNSRTARSPLTPHHSPLTLSSRRTPPPMPGSQQNRSDISPTRPTSPTRRTLSVLSNCFRFSFFVFFTVVCGIAHAQEHTPGGEATLKVPNLNDASVATFFGQSGHNLLMAGILVCVLGMVFGAVIYNQLKNAPVHRSMLEISELIYATCKV